MIPVHGLALSGTIRYNKDEKWGKGEHMRIIELKETVTASNDRDAEVLRGELKEKGTLLINLMASPGAGKTTLLERTIRDMKDRFEIAVASRSWAPRRSRPTPAACATWTRA